jgi:Ca2+-binding EF-hand superfamily protein
MAALRPSTEASATNNDDQDASLRLTDGEIRKLFNDLDCDGDGTVTMAELHEAAKQGHLGIVHTHSCLEFLHEAHVCDHSSELPLKFDEFAQFVRKREALLLHLFHNMDERHDGHVTADEVQHYMEHLLGRKVPLHEAQSFLNNVDVKHHGYIEYKDLRERALMGYGGEAEVFQDSYLNFYCRTDTKASAASGDEGGVLRTLLSGLIAGCMSRTFTAPQDRLSMAIRAGATGSPFQVLSSMLQKNGVRGLWKVPLCFPLGRPATRLR